MAVFYVDYSGGGNDNYGGTSYTLLASGTDGRISSTTFSAATANFANDGSLIGHNISIWNGTYYRHFRITAWISSTSLTIAQVTGNGPGLSNETVDRQYYIGGRWSTLKTGSFSTAGRVAPGEVIRIKASPVPTDTGITGTWNSTDITHASNVAFPTYTASTNATPIQLTYNGHGLVTGDWVFTRGNTSNTNSNGMWKITKVDNNNFTLNGSVGNGTGTGSFRKINNCVLETSVALTANIACIGNGSASGGWTTADAGNITCSLNTTTYKEGANSVSIAVGAGFTTGRAAYYPTGTLDLSGYQQISFWFYQVSGTNPTANQISLVLCSDTTGSTPVNTFNIPDQSNLGTATWTQVTVDLSTNLGSSIQSIALYINSDIGAQTFLFDNIIACKASTNADSITLSSLIGRNRSELDYWYPIESINGTRILIANGNETVYGGTHAQRGYLSSATESASIYKRECYKPTWDTSQILKCSNVGTIDIDGNTTNYITVSGGWDATNMSTRASTGDGFSWFDGKCGKYTLVDHTYYSNIKTEYIGAVRYQYGLRANQTPLLWFYKCITIGCTTGIQCDGNSARHHLSDTCVSNNNSNNGLRYTPGPGSDGKVKNCIVVCNGLANNNGYAGIQIDGSGSSVVEGCTTSNNSYANIQSNTAGNIIANCTADKSVNNYLLVGNNTYLVNNTSANSTSGGIIISDATITARGYNNTFSDTTPVFFGGKGYGYDNQFISNKHNGVSGSCTIFSSQGTITTDTITRHTASGVSWKISHNVTGGSGVQYTWPWLPLYLKVGTVALKANTTYTAKVWVNRTNIALRTRLICKKYQLAGIVNDVYSDASAAANGWEELSIQVTPTEDGVVEFRVDTWGAYNNGHSVYIDDFSIV